MADSSCTRDDRRERIVAECNAVRQALQDLLSEYMNNVSPEHFFQEKVFFCFFFVLDFLLSLGLVTQKAYLLFKYLCQSFVRELIVARFFSFVHILALIVIHP